MDDVHEPEQRTVYHAADPEVCVVGDSPRLFVLVREDFEDEGECAAVRWEVVAYGIALPNGSAATVPVQGNGFGRWVSAESASRRWGSELVWVS